MRPTLQRFFFFLFFLPIFLVGCGQGGGVKVTELKVEETIDQDHVWVEVFARLDMGNTILPISGKLPIRLPQKGLIGELELGADFISASLNLTEILKLQTQQSLLPNGSRLPLISDNQVVVIPVRVSANQYIDLYVALTAGAKAIGVTIPIAQVDRLGAELKDPSHFFPGVLIGNVRVYPGLYTSPKAGENGLGLFVDLNDVFSRLMSYGLWYETTEVEDQLDYRPILPGKRKQQDIQKYIYRLHQRKAKLSFE